MRWLSLLLAFAPAPLAAAEPAQPVVRPPAPIVPVLARTIQRGEILSVGDFEELPRPLNMTTGAIGPTAAAGREASRTLSAGAVVRAGDLVAPRLVRRGEPVMINLRSGTLLIATAGKALSSGGQGDLVRVVATSTNRTLDATVEGSGAVQIAIP